MPRRARELSALEVRRITQPGLHAVGGVSGLQLRVQKSGAKSWLMRVLAGSRRRDIGLGPYPDVTLAQAREKAREVREQISEGRDPIAEREAAQDQMKAAQQSRISFDEAARRCLEAKQAEFKNGKHRQQWWNTLSTYASPVIGELPVDTIETAHIVKVLEPIWQAKTETATRLRGRIETVLAWATTRGYRKGDNPARWRGHLDTVLPKPRKVARVSHHAAMPYSEAPAFMAELRQRSGIAARALEFTILTACRSGEVRHARWDEIDLDKGTWTIPAERMKAGHQHVVPLCDRALALLRDLPWLNDSPLVFPARNGGPMSDASMAAVLKRMGWTGVTVHGFRSTFRDWAAEQTNHPREVIEKCLAHVIGDKVEAAYRRGDLYARRASLISDWAVYCESSGVHDGAE